MSWAPALRVMVNDELPREIAVRKGPLESKVDGHILTKLVLGRPDEGDAVPCAGLTGPKPDTQGIVIWLHPNGKASLIENGKIAPAVKLLTDAGLVVLAPDVLGVGEQSFPKGFPVDKNFAGYTYGYNRSLTREPRTRSTHSDSSCAW